MNKPTIQDVKTLSNPLTEYEALVKTRYVWDFLARSPEVLYKAEAYKILCLRTDVNFCPCCQHAAYMTPKGIATDCSKCPLRSLWPYGCVRYDTPYTQWLEHVGEWKGTQGALKIMTAAQAAIDTKFPFATMPTARKADSY